MTEEQSYASQYLWRQKEQALQLVAGAGSGKTTTLIETVREATQTYCQPKEIALITFTKKAAHEMQERLQSKNLQAGYVGTMHALAWQILRQRFGRRYAIGNENTDEREKLARKLFPRFSHIPGDILLSGDFLSSEEKTILQTAYQKEKEKRGLLTLDDLVPYASESLRQEPETFFKVLLVDEFQDTSPDQIAFILSLGYQKLFAVGDDWQSIYRFRGAEVNNSLNFQKFFPQSKRLFLTRNFRSQKNIVILGNKVIRLSSSFIRKKLTAFHAPTLKTVVYIEKKFVSIKNSWNKAENFLNQKHPRITVLVRTNYIKSIIEQLLSREQKQKIEVLTIHASKGLEFEHVVIFALAKNILPHRNNDFDEEVRLLYVAVTRAQKSLDIIAWEEENQWSDFLPALVKNCKLKYF